MIRGGRISESISVGKEESVVKAVSALIHCRYTLYCYSEIENLDRALGDMSFLLGIWYRKLDPPLTL